MAIYQKLFLDISIFYHSGKKVEHVTIVNIHKY